MFFIKNDIIKNLIELLQFQKQKSLRDELQRFDSRYTVDEHHDPYKRYKSIIENIFSSVTAVDFKIKQTLDSIQVDVILNSILEAVNKSRLTRVAHKSRSKFGNIRLRRIQQTVMDKNTYLIFIKEILSAVLFTHFESTDRFRVFLTMTKLYFDDRCRQTLPKLTEKYKSDWQSLKLAERNKTYEAIVILKENLYKSEQLLQNAAFGTENLMRIVGQIYIAIITRPIRRERGLLENLLNSANAFIMSGCPFEIMNGDTTNIPLQWVHAVFKNLHDSVKGESMLVVSVLGVQSSGKSTMLNAMFGLNFAVSAGRCTSGMFMQLVKVKSKQSRYQYVLVIDSEGIRAPERICGGGYTHDNTLATLVMAISDITIINVKGETISEIEDVLQIAVHGF
ncbi:unnamed protein product [Mytilus edulis]|uniref:VLIG-type G domain-containing protein n=1 Tax=Mytilus edulis TaxID=6550 RepID=A0A8S3SAM4_MYTED|nr:unnamed protein product [Mytilus edulis]